MRFLKRENQLETLQRQLAIIDRQIGELQGQIENLTDSSKMDPILKLWLETRYGFDYTQEKAIYEKLLREKQALVCELEKERDKLQPQINEAQFQQELQQKEIRFTGPEVQHFKGSTVTFQCSSCRHKFQVDFRGFGAFQNMLIAANEQELQFLYARKINSFELKCPKCNATFTVTVWRGKI